MIEKEVIVDGARWVIGDPTTRHLPLAIKVFTDMATKIGDNIDIDNMGEEEVDKISAMTGAEVLKYMYSDDSIELLYYMIRDKPMNYKWKNIEEYKDSLPSSVAIELIKTAFEVIGESFSTMGGDTRKN